MLPGIASLALPLPTGSMTTQPTTASLITPPHATPHAVGSMHVTGEQLGCKLLAPGAGAAPLRTLQAAPCTTPASQLMWQSQAGLQRPPGHATDNVALLSSMIQQLQQQQQLGCSAQLLQQQQGAGWSSLMRQQQHIQSSKGPEPAHTAAAHAQHTQLQAASTCRVEPQILLAPYRTQQPAPTLASLEPSHAPAMLSAMLQQLNQRQTWPQKNHSHQHVQQQDWSFLKQSQSVSSDAFPPVPQLQQHAPLAFSTLYAPGQEASCRPHTESCSSRSSASLETSSNSDNTNYNLSTLLVCNERLKSQLQENELRIKRCQVRAKTLTGSGECNASEDGSATDDDSTNGTSSLSNASTTPSIKEADTAHSRYWTEEEHQKFLEAVRCFGAHNHKAIASYVTTRNSTQVRSHSQKFFKKLETFRGRGLPNMLRKRKAIEAR